MTEPRGMAEIQQRYESALDLVATIARQLLRAVGSSVSLAELESCGNEGLLEASRRFDPERGVPFRAYAYIRIRGAMLDGTRANMPLPRRAWAKMRGIEAMARVSSSFVHDEAGRMQCGESASIKSDDTGVAEAALAAHLAAMATAMAVGMLARPAAGECGEPTLGDDDNPEQVALRAERRSRLERAVDTLPTEERFIVRRHYLEGQRFDAVAKELGLSKSWASRLHRRAMLRLSKCLRDID